MEFLFFSGSVIVLGSATRNSGMNGLYLSEPTLVPAHMTKKSKVKKTLQALPVKPVRTTENLTDIADKRTGGAVNISGITYQTLYATYTLLKEFANGDTPTQLRLEGLEDIDLDKGKLTLKGKELIQLKSSINSLDASGFWDMGVLKNFLEVHRENKSFQFRFVYNMAISSGHLDSLVAKRSNDSSSEYWHAKVKGLAICPPELDIAAFLKQITFEKISAELLYSRSIKLLLDQYKVNPGTEAQYLKSTFFHALEWSRDRATVCHLLFKQTLQQVTDAFYKGSVNPAVLNGWLTPVNFDHATTAGSDYFEGKAARPEHVSQQLPARRYTWEKHLATQLEKTDVVVIKSSSGQGKSTLAWQTAINLLDTYTIYQLQHAQQAESTGPVIDFIKSRVQIGESPLIVIDGLDLQLQYWSVIVSGLADQPVKFIVTTREEDWYSYSGDVSRLNIQLSNISLNEEEARNIYQQLKDKGKVHADHRNWQTSWERVKEKGLLIEYTFLLTRGQMIGERLAHQVKKLNEGERNSGAKIEFLRMIGLADVLGLKLQSKKLLAHVQEVSAITGDRGTLLKEMELEYFIRIGAKEVEGLHPVRSAHLVELLHEFVGMEESLLHLLHIVEPGEYGQFANGALAHLEPAQVPVFLQQIAGIMAPKSMAEMVGVIEGLMRREPQLYWEANRNIFDEVFENGGIEIFIYDTLPFMHLRVIAGLQESFGEEFRNPSALQEKLDALTKYDFQKSDVAHFILALRAELGSMTSNGTAGLAKLLKWFGKLDDKNNLQFVITEVDLLNAMTVDGAATAGDLFFYFRKTQPERYDKFVTANKQQILSWLKVITDTVVAEEKDGELYLQYVFDAESVKLNDQSVRRIEQFHQFLPDYQRYRTDLIYLPFPTDDFYKVLRMDAHKAIPPESLFDLFEVQINQSWSNTILKNYEAQSVYDWQHAFVRLRKTALEFIKRCTQFFEFFIESNEQRRKAAVQPLIDLGDQVLKLIRTRQRYPNQSKRSEEVTFKQLYKELDEWVLGLQNFINQFSNIVLNQAQQHLAQINMKKMVLQLENGQRNFHAIPGQGIRYFDLSDVESEEVAWYQRLRATVEYFVAFRDQPIASAKAVIKEWWQKDQQERLLILQEGLRIVGETTPYTLRAPVSITEDEYGKDAVIGVEGFPVLPEEAEQQIFDLLWCLVPLSSLDIVTYDLIFIRDSVATGAIRVQKTYLETLLHLNDTDEYEHSEFGNPIPINLEPATIATLAGVSIPDIAGLNISQDYSKVVIDLWRLQQYRDRLNNASSLEVEWLEELTKDYQKRIAALLVAIKSSSPADHATLNVLTDEVLVQQKPVSTETCITLLNKKVAEVNQSIQEMINKPRKEK
ncbi:P-loop NTPase [Mucilaginibacter psychrotolerans]|uniref:Novel STAND NTPase 5 domain-containing protein n=1 Tax=Mucilaginibacter psychrotolerans TaxID=1524096 RepID=A0A4Y8S3B6_9SPHI|nr:hypothetical protein [Mucilaginibacter psychrotolerans]TFF33463.1 hypothetical protein E2R66_25605 [Mucilaginibacter psychrotolerans]